MKTPGKAYAIQCAMNNMRFNFGRSYFIDWALACGYTKSTAITYWKLAKKTYQSKNL